MTALRGAISLGFRTMAQPAAIAGSTLQAIWLRGQFHGVIMPQTPMGSRVTMVVPFGVSNSKLPSVSIILRRWVAAIGACSSRANLRGAPISRETVVAISSIRAV
jgi:hypothetical protein